jgi:hypothetical protein
MQQIYQVIFDEVGSDFGLVLTATVECDTGSAAPTEAELHAALMAAETAINEKFEREAIEIIRV